MEKTKRNWLLTGLLAMLMMFGLCLGFGLGGNQVQTVHALESELRIGGIFGDRPSSRTPSSSYDDVNGVLTLSSETNCDIRVSSTSGRSDLTIVFDGDYSYGSYHNEYNYLFIQNSYGDITLTSETPVTVYACIMTDGSLIVKGNVHLVPTGLPSTEDWSLLSLDATEDYPEDYGVALLTASQKISVLENASITAIDPYIISVYHDNSSILRAKYYEFDTTGEVEIGTQTQVYGTGYNYNSAICFLDTTDFNSYSEIIGRMTIKRCGQDGCLKLYRYNDYTYNFVGTKKLGYKYLGFSGYGYLHFNRNISAYTAGGVTAELMTLKPCIVTFNNGGGSGTMAKDYTYVAEDYILPACTFTAPAGKHFEGWSINGSDPVNANTTYAVPNQTETLTVTAVWEDDPADELTGTVAINGNLKFGATLTASLTNTNNTGTLSYQWRRNGSEIAEATNNTYTLTQDDIGYTISVVVSSNVETGSLVATATGIVAKADGPVAPTGIEATACTTNANNDGTITGLTTAMEYKLSSEIGWTDGTGATITNLANGTYNVRYKETATHNAGASANVVVNAYNAPILYGITVVYGGANVLSAEAGTTITITADEAPSGYVFDKWTGVGVTFANENNATTTFVMPAGDVTITATYQLMTLSITFNANGGTGTKASVQVSYGNNYTLPENPFTAPDGKEFDGWAFSANGEKITTAQITISENTELFALWKNVEVEPEPQPEAEPTGLSAGAIVGIVLAVVVVGGVGGFALVWFVIKKKKWADFVALFKKK